MNTRASWVLIFFAFALSRPGICNDETTTATFEPFFFFLAGDVHTDGTYEIQQRMGRMRNLANNLHPEFVVAVGDLVNQTYPHLFAQYNQLITSYSMPFYSIPGNHDIGPNLYPGATVENFREKIGPDHFKFTHYNCDFYALDSPVMRDRATYGAEYDAQWDWLRDTLPSSIGRQHTFFLCHHPPFTSRVTEDGGSLICCGPGYDNWPRDERSYLLALARQSGVKYFFSSHLHRDRILSDQGFTIHIPTGPQFEFDHFGTQMQFTFRIIKVLADRIESMKILYNAGNETDAPSPPGGLNASRIDPQRVSVAADASSDDTGVLFYDFYRDGVFFKRSLQPSAVDYLTPDEQLHVYSVRAIDPFGNQSNDSGSVDLENVPINTGAKNWESYR